MANKAHQDVYQSIDWNDVSKLGLLRRINEEIMHPLGLAITRDPKTGSSNKVYIAPDGFWEFEQKEEIKTDEEYRNAIKELIKSKGL